MTPAALQDAPMIAPAAADNRAPAESLAREARAGSLRAFGELMEQFERRIYGFLLRRTGNTADAEELTQETFLRAWKSIARYDDQRKFSTWLFTIASRIATDHYRQRRLAAEALPALRERTPRGDTTPVEHLAGHERAGDVWSVAARVLPARHHAALWLRYVEGLAPGEVGAVMDLTGAAVRVLLFRARRTLAATLEREHPEMLAHALDMAGLDPGEPKDKGGRPGGRARGSGRGGDA